MTEKSEFVEIINTHRNLIYKILNSYCSDLEDRKDLEQEILIQLWRSFEKFDGRVKISTWIYKIALNTAITFYRKDNTRKKVNAEITTEIISLQQFDNDSETDERITLLYKVIEGLSRIDKAVILLYLENHKHKKIAEFLGISESNVATKIGRIKKALKKKMTNHKTV